jgi:Fe-S-cluster-containing dehydrogenase component
MLGCSLFHEDCSNIGLARLIVTKDMSRFDFRIDICKHCSNPKCLADCPADAIGLDERGVVIIDDQKCIRCGSCRENCPFDAIFYNRKVDRYVKCDLCAGRVDGPLCVQLCPAGALQLAGIKSVKKDR